MRKSYRFWLIYTIAWLPYAASFVTLFMTHLGQSFPSAIKGSIVNVLPAALLGVPVVILSRLMPWSTSSRHRFLAIHLGLASLYVILWMNAVPFLKATGQLIQSGSWRFPRAGSFQGGFFPCFL